MYCPSPFLVSGSACVYDCDTEPGYTTKLGAQPRCVRKDDETKGFDLKPKPQLPLPMRWTGTMLEAGTPQTLEQLRALSSYIYTVFDSERVRVREEIAKLNALYGKEAQLRSAFAALQLAENARDKAPNAYQKARADYYTLLKGESWLAEEEERIAKAEVDPLIQKYQNDYVSLTTQINQQRQAYDTMQGIKDKVFRVKDDLTYSAKVMSEQIEKLRTQITVDRRKREMGEEAPSWYGWVDTLLNVLLVVALLAACWFVVQKLRQGPASSPAFTEATSPP